MQQYYCALQYQVLLASTIISTITVLLCSDKTKGIVSVEVKCLLQNHLLEELIALSCLVATVNKNIHLNLSPLFQLSPVELLHCKIYNSCSNSNCNSNRDSNSNSNRDSNNNSNSHVNSYGNSNSKCKSNSHSHGTANSAVDIAEASTLIDNNNLPDYLRESVTTTILDIESQSSNSRHINDGRQLGIAAELSESVFFKSISLLQKCVDLGSLKHSSQSRAQEEFNNCCTHTIINIGRSYLHFSYIHTQFLISNYNY